MIVAVLLLIAGVVQAQRQHLQRHDNRWIFGLHAYDPQGVQQFCFDGDTLVWTHRLDVAAGRWFFRSIATVSDAQGRLKYSSNGTEVWDANFDLVANSMPLSPNNDYPAFGGTTAQRGVLILPKPGDTAEYMVFSTPMNDVDTPIVLYFIARDLHLSRLRSTEAHPAGEMVEANRVLVSDSLAVGQLAACRHANGRDWWIPVFRRKSFDYHLFLLDSLGIHGPYLRTVPHEVGAAPPINSMGHTVFSPDGTRFVAANSSYYDSPYLIHLHLMDFDRCTGQLSNLQTAYLADTLTLGLQCANVITSAAFSPNSRFLYATDNCRVYQYDMNAPDWKSSRIAMYQWDGYKSPLPKWGDGTAPYMLSLAPDGKIYIGLSAGDLWLSSISSPDSAGLACNAQQRTHYMGDQISGIPVLPHYRLGALKDSPCDTLGLPAWYTSVDTTVGTVPPVPSRASGTVKVSPNPARDVVHLRYINAAQPANWTLCDLTGRVVLTQALMPGQAMAVSVAGLAPGLYAWRATTPHGKPLTWGKLSIE